MFQHKSQNAAIISNDGKSFLRLKYENNIKLKSFKKMKNVRTKKMID